jgi:hypothetical protein
LYRAEAAPPRANVAQYHKRRCPAIPALPDVGTRRALANGVQIKAGDEILELPIIVPNRGTCAQPLRTFRLLRDID